MFLSKHFKIWSTYSGRIKVKYVFLQGIYILQAQIDRKKARPVFFMVHLLINWNKFGHYMDNSSYKSESRFTRTVVN
jgi:hypothetical protein